jgi:hypothetical protein
MLALNLTSTMEILEFYFFYQLSIFFTNFPHIQPPHRHKLGNVIIICQNQSYKNLQPLRLLGAKIIALQIKKHNTNPSKKYTAAFPVSGRTRRTFILAISFRFNPSTEAEPAEKRSNKGPPLKDAAFRREPLIKGGRRSSGAGSWVASGEEAKEDSRDENARLKGMRKRGNEARFGFLLEGRRLLATIAGIDERTRVAMVVSC